VKRAGKRSPALRAQHTGAALPAPLRSRRANAHRQHARRPLRGAGARR
jgi:hypothetical protein